MKKCKFLLTLIVCAFAVSGCEKNNTPNTPAIKTIEQILTGSAWQPGELRALESNTPYYYKRGVVGSWNLDQEYILFKTDFTGIYGDVNGSLYPITWSFMNAEKTSLRFIIQYPTPLTINWEGVIYSESKIIYTQYLTRSNGTNSLAYGNRVPK